MALASPPSSYLLRASPERLAAYRDAAEAEGLSLAQWLRGLADAALDPSAASGSQFPRPTMVEIGKPERRRTRAPAPGAGRSDTRARATRLAAPSGRERASMCEHRRPPGTHCKTCDA